MSEFSEYVSRRIVEGRNAREIAKCPVADTNVGEHGNELLVTIEGGGKVADERQLPWCVAFGGRLDQRLEVAGCGVLILPDVVLTALHILGPKLYELGVFAGNHELRRAEYATLDYYASTPALSARDLALVKLKQSISCERAQPIQLADRALLSDCLTQRCYGLIAGWGFICRTGDSFSTRLIDIAMQVAKYESLEEFPYNSLYSLTSDRGGGPCEMDSGAGFVAPDAHGRPMLAGILYGLARETNDSCHTNENPVVCVDVCAVREEILRIANAISTA